MYWKFRGNTFTDFRLPSFIICFKNQNQIFPSIVFVLVFAKIAIFNLFLLLLFTKYFFFLKLLFSHHKTSHLKQIFFLRQYLLLFQVGFSFKLSRCPWWHWENIYVGISSGALQFFLIFLQELLLFLLKFLHVHDKQKCCFNVKQNISST